MGWGICKPKMANFKVPTHPHFYCGDYQGGIATKLMPWGASLGVLETWPHFMVPIYPHSGRGWGIYIDSCIESNALHLAKVGNDLMFQGFYCARWQATSCVKYNLDYPTWLLDLLLCLGLFDPQSCVRDTGVGRGKKVTPSTAQKNSLTLSFAGRALHVKPMALIITWKLHLSSWAWDYFNWWQSTINPSVDTWQWPSLVRINVVLIIVKNRLISGCRFAYVDTDGSSTSV